MDSELKLIVSQLSNYHYIISGCKFRVLNVDCKLRKCFRGVALTCSI